ncbi:MAG: oligoendopeptidase F [Rhodospirillaceae bacterium]|nr:oligoendopeptidase F [Rhodospirillaceae bacterium]
MDNVRLPEWDLSDLYHGADSKELATDIKTLYSLADNLNQKYSNKLPNLTQSSFLTFINKYESIREGLDKIGSFAYLYYCTDMNDPNRAKFYQNTQEIITKISKNLIFVNLEVSRLDTEKVQFFMKDKQISRYRPWIMDLRAERAHKLSDDLEKLFHEKHLTTSSWTRLFDETISSLRFPIDEESLTITEVINLMSDVSPIKRQAAGESMGRVLGKNIQSFALITNTLAKDKEIEDRWRSFSDPISSRNLSNRVSDKVVETLISSVEEAYKNVSHRYYKLKAQWMGVNKISYWDRNAPLPEDIDQPISWEDAKAIVLNAYYNFSPELADIGQRFFKNNWIDASPKPGKTSGAFAHPTVPSVHPYLLLNYQGKSRDVMTLAHELGHGIHQCLAANCGHLMSDTPLTLAETASVFGEQLTFQALLKRVDNPKQRKVMLASKVEDMLNTVVRQVAFCKFEKGIHSERKQGEVSVDSICEIWLECQKKSLGPALDLSGDYRFFWAYIPHFIHSPFYVYAYAFGDCLVNALYSVYKEKPDGFEKLYINLLKAGGTLPHKSLLAPFGLNAEKKELWDKGLRVIQGYIDELENL